MVDAFASVADARDVETPAVCGRDRKATGVTVAARRALSGC